MNSKGDNLMNEISQSQLRIAYMLQVHKNPKQVNTFIEQLISEDTADVYIHIDKKYIDELSTKIIKHQNVYITEKSINVSWGDISQIDATLLLINEVLKANKNYDFVCLRSGQDLLVKNGLKEYLLQHPGKIFMTSEHITKRIDKAFLNVRWFNLLRRQYSSKYHPFRLLRRGIIYLYSIGLNLSPNFYKLPNEYEYYHGSQWFCMPLNVAKYVAEFVENNSWFYKAFKRALCPDEWFFQTIIMNSQYKTNVINNNLVYIDWNGNHPEILQTKDKKSINKSNHFFARKFDEKVDDKIINYYSQRVKL